MRFYDCICTCVRYLYQYFLLYIKTQVYNDLYTWNTYVWWFAINRYRSRANDSFGVADLGKCLFKNHISLLAADETVGAGRCDPIDFSSSYEPTYRSRDFAQSRILSNCLPSILYQTKSVFLLLFILSFGCNFMRLYKF